MNRVCIDAIGLCAVLSLSLMGCQQAAQSPATSDTAAWQSDLIPGLHQEGALVSGAMGSWTIEIDPVNLTAESQFNEARNNQWGRTYSLPLFRLMKRTTFQLREVSSADGLLDVSYTVEHPFPAPTNLTGPATNQNRADLAFTGRVLFIVDDPDPDVYFAGDGDIRVNTRLIADPDGYFRPVGDVLYLPQNPMTNTFPYKLIVDEKNDNRLGRSNLGVETGNFTLPLGWGSIATYAEGPRGFDELFQGQTAVGSVAIDLAALESATISLDVALHVKYLDPRIGANHAELLANRLPRNDPAKFLYRMPMGTLDVGQGRCLDEGGTLIGGDISATTLTFEIRDWDAFAPTVVNYEGDTNPGVVPQGRDGVPLVTVDIPALGTATPASMTYLSGLGTPSDPLIFSGSITGTPPANAQLVRGLARAMDPPDSYVTGVSGIHTNLTLDLKPDVSGGFIKMTREGALYLSVLAEVTDNDPGNPRCNYDVISLTDTAGQPILSLGDATSGIVTPASHFCIPCSPAASSCEGVLIRTYHDPATGLPLGRLTATASGNCDVCAGATTTIRAITSTATHARSFMGIDWTEDRQRFPAGWLAP